jgi:hypothetical protein
MKEEGATVAGVAGEHDTALTVPAEAVGTQVADVAGEPPTLVQVIVSPLKTCPGEITAGKGPRLTLMSAGGLIVALTLLELSPGTGSFTPVGVETVTVLVMAPVLLAMPCTMTVQVPPGGHVATDPVSVLPVMLAVHPLALTITRDVRFAGMESEKVPPSAGLGPALLKTIWYWIVLPWAIVSGVVWKLPLVPSRCDLTAVRSAWLTIVVEADAFPCWEIELPRVCELLVTLPYW